MMFVKPDSKKITAGYADYINHNFGNVVDGGIIKQYLFKEGDDSNEVFEFIKQFYPEIWQEFSGS